MLSMNSGSHWYISVTNGLVLVLMLYPQNNRGKAYQSVRAYLLAWPNMNLVISFRRKLSNPCIILGLWATEIKC